MVSDALNNPSSDLRHQAIATGIQTGDPAIQAAIAGTFAAMSKNDRLVLLAHGHLFMPVATAETSLLALLKGAPGPGQILAIKAVTTRQLDGVTRILLEILKGNDEPASKEAMKALYFIATFDDLKLFCSVALSAKDEEAKRTLSSLCKRIASRIKTPEALQLVKPLG